jgi:diguanylate cyclase (GGDEF)-like protein
VQPREGISHHIGRILAGRSEAIVHGAESLYLAAHAGRRDDVTPGLADLLLEVLISATRQGDADLHSGYLDYLASLIRERRVLIRRLFSLVYLLERCALDELAHVPALSDTTATRTLVEHTVRRAGFDMLGAFTERLDDRSSENGLRDRLTALHSRAAFISVLEKEIQRIERAPRPFSIVLFSIDRLSDINREHGFETGDVVLERAGIVIRTYVREQDWVSRCSTDTFAVLVTDALQDRVEQVAERVRARLADRVTFTDSQSPRQLRVTSRMAIVTVEAASRDTRAEHILAAGERAIHAARNVGPRYVEHVRVPECQVVRYADGSNRTIPETP